MSKKAKGRHSTVSLAITVEESSTKPDRRRSQPPESRLLRKSSSASLLDTGAPAPNGQSSATQQEQTQGPPKLRRKSSSLRDLNIGKESDKKPHHSAKATNSSEQTQPQLPPSQKPSARSRKSTGWQTPKSSSSSLPPLSASASHNGHPKRAKRAGDIELSRPATIEVVVKYQLGQHELKKFKACFNQIDLDSSGVIDYDEFFEFIDETKTPFSEGLFRMIDADSNGTIDYEEFVHAAVLYCMYTRDEILQFAFDTFDTAKTGSIGEKEFKRLISVVNDGKPVFPGNFKNALADFDRNKDGVLDFEEFKVLNKRYPLLLFPCFRLQDRMQKSTLGENHWLKLHQRLYQRLKLENYQRKHHGALPALTIIGSIRKFFHLDQMDVYQP